MEMLRWVRKYLVLPKIKLDLIPKPKNQFIDFFSEPVLFKFKFIYYFLRYRLNIKWKHTPLGLPSPAMAFKQEIHKHPVFLVLTVPTN